MCGITRFTAIDHFKETWGQQSLVTDDTDSAEVEIVRSVKYVHDVVDSLVVNEALKELPVERRQVIELRFRQSFSDLEIVQPEVMKKVTNS